MDTLTDDIICHLATFCLPKDLANLGRTCQRFGGKPGGFVAKRRKKKRMTIFSTRKRQKTTATSKSAAAAQKQNDESMKAIELEGREWSLINEAARKIVEKAKETDQQWKETHLSERLTGKESWIAVYHRLESQWKCTPSKFSRFIGNGISHVRGDISHVRTSKVRNVEACSLALCQEVMTTGRHYADFTLFPPARGREWTGAIGILRPIHEDASMITKTNVELVRIREHPFEGLYAHLPRGYKKYCRDHKDEPGFEGEEHSFFSPMAVTVDDLETQENSVFGLLLDLDEGTLTIYHNRRPCGVIKRDLWGHFCWSVFPLSGTVKIQRASVPDV